MDGKEDVYLKKGKNEMGKVALCTGFPGQDACYLADLLLSKGYVVYGIVKRYSAPNWSNLTYLDLFNKGLKLITADVTDIGSLFDAVEQAQPDEFYNLAAQSFVGASWRLAHVTTQVDALGPLNCLEVIRRTNPKIKFYQAATSEMFGNANTDGFQTEDTPFMPRSPYGVAKLYGYHITKNFRESFDIFACSGILFNHESPIRGIEFVTRKVTDGVAQIIKGKSDRIILGNLTSERDWGFAGDFVEAQWLMLQQEQPQDYIIATGIKHSVAVLCQTAFEHVGLDWREYVIESNDYKRPAELHSLHAKCDKAKNQLGWEPKMNFKQMITMMVDEDIKRHL
jgi:GDPmannose 4,6-dehydratase